MIIDRSIDL
jgi:hypothetical protein